MSEAITGEAVFRSPSCECGHKKNLHAGPDATGRCVKRSCGCGRYRQATPGRDDSGEWAGGGYRPAPVVTGYGPTADAIRAEVDADNAKDKLIASLCRQLTAVQDIADRLEAAVTAVRPGPDAPLAARIAAEIREILEDR